MRSGLNKTHIVQGIVDHLEATLALLMNAAKSAHDVATDEENIADHKYDTLSLEASYMAQGQANRAQGMRVAIDTYRHLTIRAFDDDSPIAVTALVVLEAEAGHRMTVFLGPYGGGLKVPSEGQDVVVITPSAPLGKGLLGKLVGDIVELCIDGEKRELEIIAVC